MLIFLVIVATIIVVVSNYYLMCPKYKIGDVVMYKGENFVVVRHDGWKLYTIKNSRTRLTKISEFDLYEEEL